MPLLLSLLKGWVNTVSKNIDDLKGAAGNPNAGAPTWKPKKDELLAGTITEIKMVDTQFGDQFIIEVTDEDDDVFAVWCSGVVLKDSIIGAAPGVGSLIVITYGGEQKSKEGGRSYKMYDVQLDKDADTYGRYDEWHQVRERFQQKQELMQDAARQGSSLAPDSAEGMAAPF